MDSIKVFEGKIEVTFKNKELLEQALTHRSYINENRHLKMGHNERLEFLGDAVLELVITEFLFEKYPKKPEGELTAFRSSLVNTQTLSQEARRLGFNDHLRLSKGETKDMGRARSYILADMFEAVIGAIHLDQGYDMAKEFIARNIYPLIDGIIAEGSWIDGKSMFQEKAQEHVSVTPAYKTMSEQGPDHDKQFTVGVYLGKEKIAEGQGKSKQEAEQEAAKEALKNKGWI